jgi:hypothetical protein
MEARTEVTELTATAHKNWWAGLVSAGLDALRHAVKLNDQESAAWDLVTGVVKSLLPS